MVTKVFNTHISNSISVRSIATKIATTLVGLGFVITAEATKKAGPEIETVAKEDTTSIRVKATENWLNHKNYLKRFLNCIISPDLIIKNKKFYNIQDSEKFYSFMFVCFSSSLYRFLDIISC